jgi:outer membrane protein insertion porin family
VTVEPKAVRVGATARQRFLGGAFAALCRQLAAAAVGAWLFASAPAAGQPAGEPAPGAQETTGADAATPAGEGAERGPRPSQDDRREPSASPAPAPTPPAATAPPGGDEASPPAPDTWGHTEATPEVPPTPPSPPPAPLEDHGDRGEGAFADADPAQHVRAGETRVRYTLEAIEVRGNRRTHSRVILRYVPFEPGDVFDVADPAVELTRYRLLGTGYFSKVEFSLRRGSERGRVILVIEVAERNTLIVGGVWLGLSTDRDEDGHKRPLTSFGGIDVAETNLAGTGITLGSAVGVAQDQLAFRLRFVDPAIASSPLLVSAELLYSDAQDFFGNASVAYQATAPDEPRDFAILPYRRVGGNVGVGWDLSVVSQLWLHYRLETIDATVPAAASHTRNGFQPIEPIDFDVIPGESVLSALRATLVFDTRDHPFLPRRGWLLRTSGEYALSPLGSDYAYQRIEAQASHWWRLPWNHVARLELFGGAITGSAPFFEQYYVADFSDFLASRALGLSLDRRPPTNFLGTAIAEVRRAHFAAKLGGEYRVPLYAGNRSVYGIDAFASGGIIALASQHDLDDPPSLYHGVARVPVDLTGNLGLRMDTSVGGLTFAFSNVLGFIPAR